MRAVVFSKTGAYYCCRILITRDSISILEMSMESSNCDSLSLNPSTSVCSFLMYLHVSFKTLDADACNNKAQICCLHFNYYLYIYKRPCMVHLRCKGKTIHSTTSVRSLRCMLFV